MRANWKILISAFIIIILSAGAFGNSIFGNPVSRYLATVEMRDYLDTHYPGENFQIERVYYDFKFGEYYGRVYDPDDPDVSFTIAPARGYDEYITKYARDHMLSERFSKQISEMVFAIAKEEVSETAEVSAEIFVKRGKYPREAVYSTRIEEGISLHIAFRGGRVSEEEFVDKCVTVRDAVLAQGFRVDYFGFDYRWGIKREGFSLAIERGELYSTRESILAGGKVYRYESEPQKDGENWW